ncbi:hypothetical protein [Asanoa iriomotensis]|uniref:DUF2516 family protein n=1 Tax=Asanoa iriomotensis TaxID=234613 RepID=A0ABQ4C1B6_9ACTN|nr:hypothetical protein [Asanoa iriomotensis]GIF56562.1 hypothetical protein Air01nite_26570 [Asanoa iriomotensis]
MPNWLAEVGGWMLLVFGGVGLCRAATLLLGGGAQARDSTGKSVRLVLVESTALVLLGAAVLLGGRWAHLIWPALIFWTIIAAHDVRNWLRRRRSPSTRDAGQADV